VVKQEAEIFYTKNTRDGLALEALGWLLSVLSDTSEKQERSKYADEIAHYLYDHIHLNETTGAGDFFSFYEEGTRHKLLHTHWRTGNKRLYNLVTSIDCVLLEALINDDPESPITSKLVKGLMDSRRNGKWGTTQENCLALIALEKYFQLLEGEIPQFVTRVWFGNEYFGETKIRGHSDDVQQMSLPMVSVLKEANQNGTQRTLSILLSKYGRK
jgi:hypothetical protein